MRIVVIIRDSVAIKKIGFFFCLKTARKTEVFKALKTYSRSSLREFEDGLIVFNRYVTICVFDIALLFHRLSKHHIIMPKLCDVSQ